MNAATQFPPQAVVAELEKHVLIEGFQVVIDLRKSRGSCLVDAVTGRQFLDLYGFFGSLPIGYNHRHFQETEVQAGLLEAALQEQCRRMATEAAAGRASTLKPDIIAG